MSRCRKTSFFSGVAAPTANLAAGMPRASPLFWVLENDRCLHDCEEVGSLGKSITLIGGEPVKEKREVIVSSRLMMLACRGVDYPTPVHASIQHVQQICVVKH